MAVKTSVNLQRIIVFTQSPNSAPADLQHLCPQASLTVVDPAQVAWLLLSQTSAPVDWQRAIAWLRQQQFDAAVIFTAPGQSPYTLGYLCYLAGIPIRIGQSCEFGGQVLSHCSPPVGGDGEQLLSLLREWVSGQVGG
ncbi:hypothetical protein IQ265_21055 [Nodosilinea sp. LEGE 06152]|uniref:hypothetical protein n=1 Tax=Nodosilinea sp. LEGE 06152 TaxID=2777966 RepID=UPI00187EB2E2|nr:hypothetical protein [Nodosilinea sp. LEGE 06152]MBE9159300.1 hypothetical protein [Nodosilinea sp. LEGE 06152]